MQAFHKDKRSKAAVMYVEPGGYYEKDLQIEKPMVTCIVGRWKARLTRACGHAGAIAGEGDNALAKEKWFMRKFGVDAIYTPDNPVCSAKGAVVTNIAHVPEAMSAVMAKNGVNPDFEPRGNLSLKCWLAGKTAVNLPPELDINPVEAIAPYNEQIALMKRQVGAVLPRENMKDASGASMMDPKTQVSRLHGTSILDCATRSYEANLVMSLIREYPDQNGRALANVILNAFVNQNNQPGLAAADASRAAGNAPNLVLTAALTALGPRSAQRAKEVCDALVELFGLSGLQDATDATFNVSPLLKKADAKVFLSEKACPDGEMILKALDARGVESVFVRFLKELAEKNELHIDAQALLAAACCHLAWKPLMRKRLTLTTIRSMPLHFLIHSTLVGASVPASEQKKDTFRGVPVQELTSSWEFTETAFLAQVGKKPTHEELLDFSILLGLVSTNGPGTISAQGAKGAVSSDGPEAPERVQINKAYIGFLTHSGFAHGGNGFEAMAFLIDQFRESGLKNPGDPAHKLDLKAMAVKYAKEYKAYKVKAKAEGNLSYAKIPCVNHPVFKNKDVNIDPREDFVRDLFKKKRAYNIFLEFYHELVNALYETGVSKNVYCVNIDAVIASILLKMLWTPFMDGEFSEEFMESAAFSVFLYARVIGSAAEIDDHINRGRNMDTRTAASKCRYVG